MPSRSQLALSLAAIRRELPPLLELAGPVVLAELGWMAMGVVDTIMVGKLGPAAIGAVSVGSITFYSFGIFGVGLLYGLDTLVSQAFGAGRRDECNASLWQGLYIALCAAPVLMAIVWCVLLMMPFMGIHPGTLPLAQRYLKVIILSLPPLLFYTALRRYLQGIDKVAAVTFSLVSANLINWGLNWLLIYGHAGAPKLGVPGSAWATVLARIYMLSVLVVAVVCSDWGRPDGLLRRIPRPDPARIKELLSLGLGSALQITLEVAVFGAATVLAGRLAPVSLAAHQIALNIVSVTYMVPLGISTAGSVRVGQSIGGGLPGLARRYGWLAIGLGAAFMSCSAIALYLWPGMFLSIYTDDKETLAIGASLLFVAAIFQLFDGIQTVAIGCLRGAGDTRTPMLTGILGYWILGLPLGYVLCFQRGWGVIGLWIGLSLGLIVVATILLAAWTKRSASFTREYVAPQSV